jgi:hypothetical protein
MNDSANDSEHRVHEPSLSSIILFGGVFLLLALITIWGVSELGVAGSSSFH